MVNKLSAIMDRVLIKLEEQDEKTKGGVLLTDEDKKPKTIGIVTSIGEDVRSVSVGDKVFFRVFDELPALEEGIVVVRERSILGRITDE